ncbi:HEPN domain-containing protein [Vibrio metschnikovii]|uniref:ApeA N-terminal domain 1-containing protein n=1 Tax=Vibrio metschnikovii TaxID=28172 RepID=UPI001C310776|nr:HEPN domain-containing protein [Vibrio metschnikovii]
MRIVDEYIKTGYFWIPGREDKKIPGMLTINNGGDIELEVVGLFDDSIKSLNGGDDFDRIVGHVENDGLVTLDNCFYTRKNHSFGGISKSKLCVNRVLSGVAYDKNEPVTFNTLSFSVDCLDEWLRVSGIKVDFDDENKTATISYIPQENISYLLENGMKLEICFKYTLPGGAATTEAKITQKAYFKLSSKELSSLDEFTGIAYKITNFLCFATDTTVSLKNLLGTSIELQRDGGGGDKYAIPIKIYYPSIPFSEKEPSTSWHRMLFTYGTIKSNAQDVVNNWLRAYEIMAPTLSLYFSTKNGAQKYLDGKFLALAQGLETYHRRTSDEKLMESSEFETLVSKITKNCPDENVDWLKGRLMYGNEINLANRLKRIIEPFKDKLGNSKERSKLLRQIVDTRNYLTHYNEDLRNSSADGSELWILCQKMEVIFQLHFLKVIGFSEEEINSVVENCYQLRQKLKKI